MVSLEAIACGRPLITHLSLEHGEYRGFPLKDVATEEIVSSIGGADIGLWQEEHAYLKEHHSPERIVESC